MSDLISRQDALNAIHDLKNKLKFIGDANYRMCIQAIESVPSAQRTGHWTYKNGAIVSPWYSSYECSECGCLSGYFKYCPECGSRNRGDEE